ncbi:TetR/AcrR family transcriptional regulator [Mycolicibacterium goodii]|uniref:TetR/AcrR family transcriptional regulator n=1 Tax=Mycolicibacterium goodii TaxID=134601 RepID=UPI001BDCE778|nr:TetR/AcrR family transcriptional regulator [Mycolicibacterium goodii]MBU8820793.1 TetR/AcrR family transcriptional regulator [Mycolicibacterium goodii]
MAKAVSPRGTARDRVLSAASALFAENGVNGTSLQMVADRLAISKASVYFQFKTKEEMVISAVRPVFDDLARVVAIATELPSSQARRDGAVVGLVELVVRNRSLSAVFFGDPAISALVRCHPKFEETLDKLDTLIAGPRPDSATRVAVSMVTAGICSGTTDPRLRDVADDELRRELIQNSQRCLQQLPERQP